MVEILAAETLLNNPMAYAVVALLGAIDAVWLLFVVSAVLRSNEKELREHERQHRFWRRRRAALAATRERRSWAWAAGLLIDRHKLVRCFVQRYDALVENPLAQLTGKTNNTVNTNAH